MSQLLQVPSVPAISWRRRAHFVFVVFVAFMSVVTVMPLKPDVVTASLVKGRPFSMDSCGGNGGSKDPQCVEARSTAALWLGVSQCVNSCLSIVCGPLGGVWGDARGRRGVFRLAMVLLVASSFTLLLATLVPGLIWLFLVVETLQGACPVFVVILSIIADETSPVDRPAAFGLFQGLMGIATMLGPFSSIVLTLRGGCILSLLASLVALVSAVLYPESAPAALNASISLQTEECGMPVRRRSWIGIGTQESVSWQKLMRPQSAMRLLCSSMLLRRLSLCILCTSIGIAMLQSCLILFIEAQLEADRRQATWYLIALASSCLFAAVFILRPLANRIGLRRTLLVGIVLQLLANVFYIGSSISPDFAVSKVFVLIGTILAGFSTLNFPMIAAMKCNAVPASMQGRIQGAIGSVQYFALAMGPLIGGSLFSFASRHQFLSLGRPFYAAPFVISVLLLVIAVCISYGLPSSAENCQEIEELEVSPDGNGF